ncbi:MAG: hypothetical protein R8G66_13190 [Cytophagales bacterium]|nr:hypothetical protein [Cytophagales bacterium]
MNSRKFKYLLLIQLIMLLGIVLSPQTSYAQKFLPTKLKVTVINGQGNAVKNATVRLFLSEEDYIDDKKSILSEKTNEKGQVIFKKMKPRSYYIDARKGDLNNDGRGSKTDKLKEGRVNRVNVVIE